MPLETAKWFTAADEEVMSVRAVSCQAALLGVRVEVDAHQVCDLADAAGQVGDQLLVAQGEDVGPVALGPPAGDVLRSGPAGGGEPLLAAERLHPRVHAGHQGAQGDAPHEAVAGDHHVLGSRITTTWRGVGQRRRPT